MCDLECRPALPRSFSSTDNPSISRGYPIAVIDLKSLENLSILPLSSIVSRNMRHSEAFFVVPAEPTPKGIKQLSDIDDQVWLRSHHSLIMFYKNSTVMTEEEDPAKVIMRAMSQALVHYYPLAGRLIDEVEEEEECPQDRRKLFVDCNGEGVLFIEADADVSLEELGDSIGPPCPYIKQFLRHVPGSHAIIACPLLLFQVTRFSCGGFAVGVRMNHVICDTLGIVQFLNAVSTFSRNPHAVILPPVWQRRHIFTSRDPPLVTCIHPEYDNQFTAQCTKNDMAHEFVFFGPKHILTLRNRLPFKLRNNCSTFDLLSACLWKCRTIALNLNQNDVVAFSAFRSARAKIGVPNGYYGNAFGFPAAVSKANSLCENPLEYALGLITEAKRRMNRDYLRSLASLVAMRKRPMCRSDSGHFLVGDTTRVGLDGVDFGWGEAVYGGPAGAFDQLITFFARFRDGIVVPMMLPRVVMKRFRMEVMKMTSDEESLNCCCYDENDEMETRGMSKL